MKKTPTIRTDLLKRIFVNDTIEEGVFALEDSQIINRLVNVLRVRVGDEIILFDRTQREWQAKITNIHKKHLTFETVLSPKRLENDISITLAFSPIKQERMRFLLEKCTEIGVKKFIPIIFDRTIVRDISQDKLREYMIGACEQSGRTSIPEIADALSVSEFLMTYQDSEVIFCNEKESDFLINKVIIKKKPIVVIGPEGGITDQERKLFETKENVTSVSLGKNILRAETASIFSLSCLVASQM